MSKLPYLISEINAAMEVYLSGRTGQQYNRTAFILCDDAAELSSKLLLIVDNAHWSDTKANGHFKRFVEVTADVRAVFIAKRAAEYNVADAVIKRIEARRNRRNDFFHSTHLLDLNFHARDCVEAFVDLLDYGKLLFPNEWDTTVAATGNMETSEAILRVDKKTYTDPGVTPKLHTILKAQPRLGGPPSKRGCEVVHHPEDYHLRLCIRNGGKSLRDKLRALLAP
jgi:hypothetical protein